ncbi:MAG TPA: PilZ domain-containing protein [Terriglobales bacterium]|nr:PilZ domain-containing protein [Terriglobales bacterium]
MTGPQERRKFERVAIPESSGVFAADARGKRAGTVKMLGRGGMHLDTTRRWPVGAKRLLVITDEREGIRRRVHTVVRYAGSTGVGLEFEKLTSEAAVEIGVIIGRYYTQPGGPS